MCKAEIALLVSSKEARPTREVSVGGLIWSSARTYIC